MTNGNNILLNEKPIFNYFMLAYIDVTDYFFKKVINPLK